jgi:hypothetical protein
VEHGDMLVTGSEDGTVRLWIRVGDDYVALGQPVVTGTAVRAVSPDADGDVLVAYGNHVDRWRVSVEDWLAMACRSAGRKLTDQEAEQYLGGRQIEGCH